MTLSAILWDVDGTLIDTTALITDALDFIYRKYFGKHLPYDERRALIGIPLKKQIRVFGELETFGIEEAAITEDFIVFYETHRDRERILADVIAILREGKRRGLPTGLVTSKNREELENTLPRLELAGAVDLIISADDVARPKPDPEGLRLALARFAIAPEQAASAVFIGDTTHDMQAARLAGVRGIGVTWGAAIRSRLESESPAHIVDTPAELHALLFPNE